MSTFFLAVGIASLALLLVAFLLPVVRFSFELVEAKHRRRHAARRRARRKGYMPVFDEDYLPFVASEEWTDWK